MIATPHILHVFSTFGLGGPQIRTCDILNALGSRFRHTITATDGEFAAAGRLHPDVPFRILPPPPGKGSLAYPIAFCHLLRRARPDLMVTYNWGAFDAAVAGALLRTCRVVHTEDGFGADEVARMKSRRVWARRLLFRHIDGLVVPSRRLLEIATSRYGVAERRVDYIPNGVDLDRFQPRLNRDLRRRWGFADTDCVIGFVGRLSTEKNVPLLLRAFAALREPRARLAIVGDGPCRGELERLNRDLGAGAVFAGRMDDTAPAYGALDLFALSSDTEQMPVTLLEAMACGLPAVATAVGDSDEILGSPGFPAIVPKGDEAELTRALRRLCDDPALRAALGASNRIRVARHYSIEAMVRRYEAVYRRLRVN